MTGQNSAYGMIHYDPHNWMDHLFDIRGTLVREISYRVLACVLWAAIVLTIHTFVRPLGIGVTIHSLVGVALGLLLVFRTNAAYDRFWEGRKLWGAIVNETRNIVRMASVQFHESQDLLWQLTRWTAIFPWATMSTLRGESNLGPAAEELEKSERAALESSQHLGLHVALRMSQCVQTARERGHIGEIAQMAIDQNVQSLVDYLGGCERIRKTPLPFAYVVHLRRALILYCFTLPFALVDQYGWWTLLDVLLVAYTFLGIEEIGVEIEGPFGNDENDLPLETICETIHQNIYALAGMYTGEPEKLPEGL